MKALLVTTGAMLAVALALLAGLTLTGFLSTRHPGPATSALATSALLLLPVLGLASLSPHRTAGLLVGGILWPLALLAGLPLVAPGEREQAIFTGLTLAAVPFSKETSGQTSGQTSERESEGISRDTLATLAGRLDTWLPTPRSRPPPPLAEPVEAEPAPASADAAEDPSGDGPSVATLLSKGSGSGAPGDLVVLPYEGHGHTLEIPVTLESPDGEPYETRFLFDTGATYTTLRRDALRDAGYRVPRDAPRITSRTANGEIETPLVVVERLWVGGLEVPGVTVAVCDRCATDASYTGLLGLNVSGRFLVTLDTAAREMVLQPRTDSHPSTPDVRPWLELDGTGLYNPGGTAEITVEGFNTARRIIREATVTIACPGGDYAARLGQVPAGGQTRATLTLPRAGRCREFRLSLERATW